MTSQVSESRFNKAITDLQADFKILPVGVTKSGAWRYAFAYDIVARHYSEFPDLAHEISENQAREKLLEHFANALGAFELHEAKRLFGWSPREAERAQEALLSRDFIHRCDEVSGRPGEWLAVTALL
jgi:hypothetical protein